MRALWFFLGLVLSIQRYGIGIGGFEITFSEVVLIILVFLRPLKVNSKLGVQTILLTMICWSFFSAFFAIDYLVAILNILPLLYGYIIFILLGQSKTLELSSLFNGMLISGIIGSSVAIISGIIYYIPLFYPEGSNRFSFLTQNSNQWAAFIASISIIRLYSIHFNSHIYINERIKSLGLLVPTFFTFSILFSGSKTGFLIVFSILALEFFLVLGKISLKRITQLVVIAVASFYFVNSSLLDHRVVNRAFAVIELFTDQSSEANSRNIEVRSHQYESVNNELYVRSLFTGVGLGNFKFYSGKHEMHNSWASLFLEIGLFGSILYLYVAWSCFVQVKSWPEIVLFLLFIVMNTTHIYYRERWVWAMLAIILYTNNNKASSNAKIESR